MQKAEVSRFQKDGSMRKIGRAFIQLEDINNAPEVVEWSQDLPPYAKIIQFSFDDLTKTGWLMWFEYESGKDKPDNMVPHEFRIIRTGVDFSDQYISDKGHHMKLVYIASHSESHLYEEKHY
jgi:hypothetical protein